MIDRYDDLITYCPQLGGEVPFRYCRTVNERLPCRRIFSCWEFRLDVEQFVKEHYSEAQRDRAFSPPTKTRIETILEIAERAKRERDGVK
jgi:hypothetical protein